MRALLIMAAALALAGQLPSGPAQPWTVPLVAKSTAAIDGAAAPNEYPASFTDPKTGITVWWQADSANIYAALASPGKGWLAIGLGAEGMNGSAMVVALADGQGQWTVEEHLGRSLFRHARAEPQRLIAAKAGLAGGHTTMEFSLPRQLGNGKTIVESQALPFILAYHKDKPTLSKHSKKTSGTLVIKPAAK